MTNVRKLYGRYLRILVSQSMKSKKDEIVQIFKDKLKKKSGFWD